MDATSTKMQSTNEAPAHAEEQSNKTSTEESRESQSTRRFLPTQCPCILTGILRTPGVSVYLDEAKHQCFAVVVGKR